MSERHVQIGQWVRDQYDRTGRVYTIHSRCPSWGANLQDAYGGRDDWDDLVARGAIR